MEGVAHSGLNLGLFRSINGWPDNQAPFWKFLSEATNYGWFKALLLLLVIVMVTRGGRGRKAALCALIAFPLANGLTDLWKNLGQMPRPFQELSDVHLRAGWSNSFGTASAHSANMAAVATAFILSVGWWGSPWVPIAVLVGISRIYVGVHYPYQVVLGWTMGILAGFAVTQAWDRIAARRSHVQEEQDTDAPEL